MRGSIHVCACTHERCTDSGACANPVAAGPCPAVPAASGAERVAGTHGRHTACAAWAAVLLLRFATPSWNEIYQAPSLHHWLGTDALGRDQLVRVLWGCRISLLVGVAASLVSVIIGVLWGATAGYAGGSADSVMMRFVDILYTVPFIPLVIVMTVLFGRNFLLVFVAIGAVSWLDIARIVRGQTLSLKQREFIEAARALGVRTPTMIIRHLVPNLIGVVIIYATLTVPTVILFEAFLSFLGLGVHAPLASLGSLVSDGADHLQSQPYLLTAPAVLLGPIICLLQLLG